MDILLTLEVPFTLRAEQLGLYHWARRSARRSLGAYAHTPHCSRLVDAYSHSLDDLAVHDAFRRAPELTFVFDALVTQLAELLADATLARLDQNLSWFDRLMHRLLDWRADLREVAANVNMAELLARNLRGGLMDELGWPAQDAVNDGFSSDAGQFDTDGPFPYWIMHHVGEEVIVVLGPTGEVHRAPLPSGVPSPARAMRFVEGDILYFSIVGSLYVARWLSRPDRVFATQIWNNRSCGVTTPEGNVWEGTRTLRPHSR